jgi:hypothetical protein
MPGLTAPASRALIPRGTRPASTRAACRRRGPINTGWPTRNLILVLRPYWAGPAGDLTLTLTLTLIRCRPAASAATRPATPSTAP